VFHQGKNELSGSQDQSEDTAHTLQHANSQVFHIQTLLLVEAIAVFDAAAQAPIGVDLLGDGHIEQGDVGRICLPPRTPRALR